jgi:hypothetical protein
MEDAGDNFCRLALLEELKALPFGAVWDYHCLRLGVPTRDAWMRSAHTNPPSQANGSSHHTSSTHDDYASQDKGR